MVIIVIFNSFDNSVQGSVLVTGNMSVHKTDWKKNLLLWRLYLEAPWEEEREQRPTGGQKEPWGQLEESGSRLGSSKGLLRHRCEDTFSCERRRNSLGEN